MTKLKDKGVLMKFLKIACLLFSMFLFSSIALAEDSDISVSGPDILTDGACYSADGGNAPYLWKTSEGSMDNSGCVSNVSAQCGSAVITASDDCRATGSKEAELTEGCPSISGPDAPSDGSCYGADNATGEVQWGITKGSIDSNGCVSNISSQCGAATVVATDSSGNTSVRDVRMPGGEWVSLTPGTMIGLYCRSGIVQTVVGIKWSLCSVGCFYISWPDDIKANFYAAGGTCPPYDSYSCASCGGGYYQYKYMGAGDVYEWRCP